MRWRGQDLPDSSNCDERILRFFPGPPTPCRGPCGVPLGTRWRALRPRAEGPKCRNHDACRGDRTGSTSVPVGRRRAACTGSDALGKHFLKRRRGRQAYLTVHTASGLPSSPSIRRTEVVPLGRSKDRNPRTVSPGTIDVLCNCGSGAEISAL